MWHSKQDKSCTDNLNISPWWILLRLCITDNSRKDMARYLNSITSWYIITPDNTGVISECLYGLSMQGFDLTHRL